MARTPRAPRITLEITEDLIADAIPRDSSHCLWAEAVKAAVPDSRSISVDIQTIRFTDPKKGLRYTYLTPRVAQVALVEFDQGIRPIPHSVQLRNGQVTAAGVRKGRNPLSTLSPQAIEQRRKAGKKGGEALAKATKARLQKSSGAGDTVPARVGGKTPPIAAGKRRAFGVRGLQY